MTLSIKKQLVFSLLFGLFCLNGVAQQDKGNLYNLDNSLLFANYLFKSQQYQLAAFEYERVLFVVPQNDSVQIQLLKSYSLSGNKQQMISRAESLYPSSSLFPQTVAKLYTTDAFKVGQFFKLNDFTSAQSPLPKRDRLFLHLHILMNSLDWETAELTLQQLTAVSNESYKNVNGIILAGKEQRYKSPALAATLSTIIPGTGKIYTGDWKDALFGLLILGGNAYSSYRGFKKKGIESVQGWTFASIGFGFYMANIFGAHKAAKRYNARAQSNLRMQVLQSFEQNY